MSIRDAQVAGYFRDHPAVLKLAKDLLGLGEQSQRLRFLPGMGVCHRHIVQGVALARTVARGSHQWQRLLVISDGFPLVPEIVVHLPDGIERAGLGPAGRFAACASAKAWVE